MKYLLTTDSLPPHSRCACCRAQSATALKSGPAQPEQKAYVENLQKPARNTPPL